MKSFVKQILKILFNFLCRITRHTSFYSHSKRIYYSIFREKLNRGLQFKYLYNYVKWYFYLKPLHKKYTIKLENNMLSVVYPDSDSGESNIFTKNVDFYENQFIRKHLQKNDFIIDTGCNVGNRTLVLADIISGSLLIDANQECLNRVNSNFLLNNINMENYHLVNKAVGSKCGSVFFTDFGGTSCLNKIDNKNGSNKIKVEMTTIDEEMKNIGNPQCSYIKFDLEGYDLEGIKGSINTLKNPSMKFIKFERWKNIPYLDFKYLLNEINWIIFTINSELTPILNENELENSFNLFACSKLNFNSLLK